MFVLIQKSFSGQSMPRLPNRNKDDMTSSLQSSSPESSSVSPGPMHMMPRSAMPHPMWAGGYGPQGWNPSMQQHYRDQWMANQMHSDKGRTYVFYLLSSSLALRIISSIIRNNITVQRLKFN